MFLRFCAETNLGRTHRRGGADDTIRRVKDRRMEHTGDRKQPKKQRQDTDAFTSPTAPLGVSAPEDHFASLQRWRKGTRNGDHTQDGPHLTRARATGAALNNGRRWEAVRNQARTSDVKKGGSEPGADRLSTAS